MAIERFHDDIDFEETREWLEAFESLLDKEGPERAKYLLERLNEKARRSGVNLSNLTTPYINTIESASESLMPGDAHLERRVRSLIRWNALAMVMRANDNDDELGGHISSFASAAHTLRRGV